MSNEGIKTKIDQALSEGVTLEKLNSLRSGISCLSAEAMQDIKAYIRSKTDKMEDGVQENTRSQLDSLVTECAPSEQIEKIPESKSSFDRVFDGTRSTVFSEKNKQLVRSMVETNLQLNEQKEFFTPEYRENIMIAMTDRLLNDRDFQGIFNTSVGFADVANSVMKGNLTEATTGATEKATKKEVLGLEDRIAACISRVTEPLKTLIAAKKNTPELGLLLSNPQAIASFNGGEVPTGIEKMKPEDMEVYMKSLNGKILDIDRRILPLEQIRERGMDFLASGPDFLKDIFRWLLELPFIGKMLAMFLGYSNQKEAISGLDEELRQRKSLNTLREFGMVTDVDGKVREGKYMGKIDLLKWQDLSKIDRKSLSDFFQLTREEGIDDSKSDFWISVFEEGKMISKDTDGKEIIYDIGKIDKKDLDKDYDGLYKKLNSALDQKKKRVYSEKQTRSKQTAETARREADQKKQTETEIGKYSTQEVELKPYSNLFAADFSPELQNALSQITLQGLSDGNYLSVAQKALSDKRYDSIREYTLIDLTTLGSVINGLKRDNKLEGFLTQYKNQDTGKFDTGFKNVFSLRRELLGTLGYTEVYLNKPTQELTRLRPDPVKPIVKAAQSDKKITPEPIKKDRATLLADAFRNADSLPFEFDGESVAFKDGRLIIGSQQFRLEVTNGVMSPSVSNVEFLWSDVRLSYMGFKNAIVDRAKIIEGLPELISMENNARKEIAGVGGKLIVTRVA